MGGRIILAMLLSGLLAAPAQAAQWLAGDLHVHTCFSHDAWCPAADDNAGPEDFYTLSLDVGGRFAQAAAQGLDFLAISDHNDVRSSADPSFGSGGVTGLPAYENSLDGHAQMLGAGELLDNGDSGATRVAALAQELRSGGGAFQVNHPGYRTTVPFADCDDTGALDWGYGYEVVPDVIEVVNPTAPVQVAERWWECWLGRGAHVGATGGSDSHYAWTAPVQGPGQPTTWVLADGDSPAALLEGIRAGRTSISRRTPRLGGSPLLLEADADRDGRFEPAIGETVPAGTPLRVRSAGPAQTGFVRVRAGSAGSGEAPFSLVEDAPLAPGGTVELTAPGGAGWVRASLHTAPGSAGLACDPRLHQAASLCPYDQLVEGLASPVYVTP